MWPSSYSYYSSAAKDITDKKVTDVAGVFKLIAGLIPADDRFEAAVSGANVAQPQMARYYLRSLQMMADRSKQYGPLDSASVTLEHILPKDPRDYPAFSLEEARCCFQKNHCRFCRWLNKWNLSLVIFQSGTVQWRRFIRRSLPDKPESLVRQPPSNLTSFLFTDRV
jgi:hypothetical protein